MVTVHVLLHHLITCHKQSQSALSPAQVIAKTLHCMKQLRSKEVGGTPQVAPGKQRGGIQTGLSAGRSLSAPTTSY